MKKTLSGSIFIIFSDIPVSGCLIINPSTFSESIVLIVSSSDSPFSIEECEGEKSITSKPSFFAACSKESFVLVLGSQKIRQTVFLEPPNSGQSSYNFRKIE